jgi:hypothetical protein
VNPLLTSKLVQPDASACDLGAATARLPAANLCQTGAALSSVVKIACAKLQDWISNNPDSRQADLQALRAEIKAVITDDDNQRRLNGKPEDKAKLLDAGTFFSYDRAVSERIPKIEKEWIETYISVAVVTLADPAPELDTLKKLDATIRTFNKTYSESGWNFSLVLFEQLCLNRFEIGEPLSAALRLSGQGTKQPGEFGYRMAAMTLFLLGMHVKSSMSNELEYDLRPMKSLALATEALRDPENQRFQKSVPEDLQSTILDNLKAGLTIFLYSSSKFWNQQEQALEPLQAYLRDNRDFLKPLIEDACARTDELSSLFVRAGAFWLHSNIFKARTLPETPLPGSWDEILLSPHEGQNIYWYRVVLGGYIPAFLFEAFDKKPEVFKQKNSEGYALWRQNFDSLFEKQIKES